MSYRSPVSGTELQEVVRGDETVLLDTTNGQTFSKAYAKSEGFEEFTTGKKETKKAPAKKPAAKPAAKPSTVKPAAAPGGVPKADKK